MVSEGIKQLELTTEQLAVLLAVLDAQQDITKNAMRDYIENTDSDSVMRVKGLSRLNVALDGLKRSVEVALGDLLEELA